MSRTVNFFFLSLLTFFFITGCHLSNEEKDIFQYKDAYVGDNSKIGNMVSQLLYSEQLAGIELQTKEEPYGVILKYSGIDGGKLENVYQKPVVYNATYLFSLVQNVEWVKFRFNEAEYVVTKDKLENWYGKDLRSFSSKEELEEFIQGYLSDENKVKQLFQ